MKLKSVSDENIQYTSYTFYILKVKYFAIFYNVERKLICCQSIYSKHIDPSISYILYEVIFVQCTIIVKTQKFD